VRDVLVDAGPLVALVDARDRDHEWARDRIKEVSGQVWTVWPAVTEAAYILRRRGPGPAPLLRALSAQAVQVVAQGHRDLGAMEFLLGQYSDLPMDLADAAVVRAYHTKPFEAVMTTDVRDFSLYRINGKPLNLITPAS
jgi:predicted nucleic acid-binding protein